MKKNLNNLILGGAQISSTKYGIVNHSSIKKGELKKLLILHKKIKLILLIRQNLIKTQNV